VIRATISHTMASSAYDAEIDGPSGIDRPLIMHSDNPFEEVSMSNEYDGKIGQSSVADDESFLKNNTNTEEAARKKEIQVDPNASCFSIAYYQPYFDIDTATELDRLWRSLQPWKTPFFRDEFDEKPDLYGPFWIATTLAFMMAAFGNLARFWTSNTADNLDSDVQKISNAASWLYIALIVVPLLIWILIKYFSVEDHHAPALAELVSLYGYSLFPYVPTCILCVVPLSWFRTTVVVLAAILSSLLLLANIYTGKLRENRKKGLPVAALIVVCQAGLAVILRLYFFSF